MGLIRLFLLFLAGYFLVNLVKKLFLPNTHNKTTGKEPPQKEPAQYKNIEDADYEELE